MRARSARPGVGFPVREIRGEAPSDDFNSEYLVTDYLFFVRNFK